MAEAGTFKVSAAWTSVDRDAEAARRYLDLAATKVGQLKSRTSALLALAPGASALEVGCGVGRDAEALAHVVGPKGRVVAVDASQELIAQATARTKDSGLNLSFQVADALALPFEDGSFDGCRIERVLQHLVDPQRAVRELARVTRAGGRVAAMEPDWFTLCIAANDLAVSHAIILHRATDLVRNGAIGRELPALLRGAGCHDLIVEAGVVWLQDLATAATLFNINDALNAAVERGLVPRDAAQAWWDDLRQRDANGTFYASVNGVIAAGVV